MKPLPFRLPPAVVALAALSLTILLNGCASTHLESNQDPYKYNPNAGYPLMGGPAEHTDCGCPSDLRRPAPQPDSGGELPRLDPHTYDLGQDPAVFPKIEPHEY